MRAAVIGSHAVPHYMARFDDGRVPEFSLPESSPEPPRERNLLLAIDRKGPTLAVAAITPALTGFRARQLRIPLERPSKVAAEILGGLTPRASDTALTLSARVADALADEGITARFFREFTRLHARATDAVAPMPVRPAA